MPAYTLADLAQRLDARLHGDPACLVTGLGTLASASASELAFLTNSKYRTRLQQTKAAAVLVRADDADACPVGVLVVDDPYAAYAHLSALFSSSPVFPVGIHPTAVVSPDACVAATAAIGPHCVIEAGAVVGERTVLQAGVYLGHGSVLGDDCHLHPQVTLYHGVRVGHRVRIHGAAVIGADGFGFAPSAQGWIKIHQNGGVRIDDDVEIGAGTTIDRGAIDDTWIETGVIIDNQVQIAHNVRLGKHTAIAGCTAIAGSTRIGARCTVAGAVGITGHLDITDDVHVTAMSLITHSIDRPGAYSSGTAMAPRADWRRNAVRFLHLDRLFRRVAELEKRLGLSSGNTGSRSSDQGE